MNIALWIIQVLFSFMFLFHGRMMLMPPPREKLQRRMVYVVEMPARLRVFAGVAEALAAVGLILPGVTGILPWLTPLAASGLGVLMIGAIVFHIPRREYSSILLNLVLLAISGFVAFMRWVVLPL